MQDFVNICPSLVVSDTHILAQSRAVAQAWMSCCPLYGLALLSLALPRLLAMPGHGMEWAVGRKLIWEQNPKSGHIDTSCATQLVRSTRELQPLFSLVQNQGAFLSLPTFPPPPFKSGINPKLFLRFVFVLT